MFNKSPLAKSTKGKEDGCRGFFLEADIKQTRLAMILFAIPFAAFVINDYAFFKLSMEFFGLVALRLALLGAVGFEFFLYNQSQKLPLL